MPNKEELVITFQSVNHTMQAEKTFEDHELDLKIIPTPREISSSCGLSILTNLDYLDQVKELEKDGMHVDNYWKFTTDEEGKKEAELIEK